MSKGIELVVGTPTVADGTITWLVTLRGPDDKVWEWARSWERFEKAALAEVVIWASRHDRWMLQKGMSKYKLGTEPETCMAGVLNIRVIARRKR